MSDHHRFLADHVELARRYFLKLGVGSLAAGGLLARAAGTPDGKSILDEPELAEPLAKLEPYFTPADAFNDVSRGNPIPHKLSDEQKTAAGLTRETWRLEIIADADHKPILRTPLTKAAGTAIDFARLVQLGEKHAVRFAKVMTCLNIGCPLGMGVWEGVPLRELMWLATPGDNVRRLFYYGFHNDDPKQIFRSSLPIGRVLEDPFDLPPVIVCYKLNGEWLTSERGGPVRIIAPEAYGFKSVKWLSHVVLTNLPHANDTYAEQGNDIDSPLKTFAATLFVPSDPKAGAAIPLTGYAQVGMGGLSKVQVWIQPNDKELPAGDPHFKTAPWLDMEVLPPPKNWGALPDGKMLPDTLQFDATGQPRLWPMRLCKVHWAGVHPPLSAGKYTLRCRTVDAAGHGQPLPRPFRKSGHAAIEQVDLVVK